VKKGSGTLKLAYVRAPVEMINQQKYASEVVIVSHVSKSVGIMRDAEGNQQKNALPTVKRSGTIVNALVVLIVDHVRESVRIILDVASRKLAGANETVKKGSGTLKLAYVKALVEMINHQKYASVVLIVVHVSKSVQIIKDVAGKKQGSVSATV